MYVCCAKTFKAVALAGASGKGQALITLTTEAGRMRWILARNSCEKIRDIETSRYRLPWGQEIWINHLSKGTRVF